MKAILYLYALLVWACLVLVGHILFHQLIDQLPAGVLQPIRFLG